MESTREKYQSDEEVKQTYSELPRGVAYELTYLKSNIH